MGLQRGSWSRSPRGAWWPGDPRAGDRGWRGRRPPSLGLDPRALLGLSASEATSLLSLSPLPFILKQCQAHTKKKGGKNGYHHSETPSEFPSLSPGLWPPLALSPESASGMSLGPAGLRGLGAAPACRQRVGGGLCVGEGLVFPPKWAQVAFSSLDAASVMVGAPPQLPDPSR